VSFELVFKAVSQPERNELIVGGNCVE